MRLVKRLLPVFFMTIGVTFLAGATAPQLLSWPGTANANPTAIYGTGVNLPATSVTFQEEDDDEDEDEAEGVIASINSTGFVLEGGMAFVITAETEIEGELSVGALVEVEYETSNGRLIALEVEVGDEEDEDEDDVEDEDGDKEEDEEGEDGDGGELEFEGVVASINDTELVLRNGTTFQINDSTEIESGIAVGDEVDVDAIMLALELEAPDSEDDEMEFEGVVVSISDTRLALSNGSIFTLNSDTEFEVEVRVGMLVDVDAVESNGSLIATEVDSANVLDDDSGFEGVVSSITVTLEDGRSFLLNGDSEFEGLVQIGTQVDIDAVLLALEIEASDGDDEDEDGMGHEDADEDDGDTEDEDDGENGSKYDDTGFKSRGVVARLNDSSISLNTGRSFRLTERTTLQGNVQVGAEVEVTFEISMGTLVAKKVAVSQASQASAVNEVDLNGLQAKVDNRFFPLEPLALFVYEGVDEGAQTSVEIRVLPDTMRIAGIDVTAALVEEYEDGELTERTLDYYAQGGDGTVYYIGEHVDEVEGGVVSSHSGQWIAGEGESLAGIFMPANPKVGDEFEQERAPGLAEDESKVTAVGLTVRVPAGTYMGCIETEDFDPIGGGRENKFYCPGVGLVREADHDGALSNLARVGTFSASEIDQDLINAIGHSEVADAGSNNDGSVSGGVDVEQFRDEDGDLIMVSSIASFSSTEVTLTNGITIAITSSTDIVSRLSVGASVEIEFEVRGGQLVAIEID